MRTFCHPSVRKAAGPVREANMNLRLHFFSPTDEITVENMAGDISRHIWDRFGDSARIQVTVRDLLGETGERIQ